MSLHDQRSPPRWADRLLEKFCRKDYLEEIQGDLHESFYWRLEEKGVNTARWLFVKEILTSFRMSNLKTYHFMDQILILFKSHMKTGWRFLWKTKAYSSINILGLSVGIVFSWFAYLYSADQFSYNKHLKNVEDLYKVSLQVSVFDNLINLSGNSHATAQKIVEEIPEVLEAARFRSEHKIMKLGESTVDQDYLIAEQSLLDYLNLTFVEGNAESFDSPNQAIISEQLAYKLGIRGEAVNKEVSLKDSSVFTNYKIVGVYETIPQNTSIKSDLFIPYIHYLNESSDNATNESHFDVSTILKLAPQANSDLVTNKINELVKGEKESASDYIYNLQQVASLHLADQYFGTNGFLPGGNEQLIWLIIIAGVLCLAISIINYANFSISMYINRAREVAVRKIMGSANSGVFQQLMTESFLTTFIAAIIALGLFTIITPQFSELVEKQFNLKSLLTWNFIPGVIGIIFLISILSGLYPSILLSRFKIIKSLKGAQKTGKGKVVMQTLLTLQFSISIAMIACMFTFKGQLNFLKNIDRGYDVENVLRITLPIELTEEESYLPLITRLREIPELSHISPVAGYGMSGYKNEDTEFSTLTMKIDNEYLDLMGIKMIQGTDLTSAKKNGVSNGVLVNEAFLKKSKEIDQPIGTVIPYSQNNQDKSTIVGVVKDFYSFNPRNDIKPLVFSLNERKENHYTHSILVKTTTDRFNIEDKIGLAWKEIYQNIPLKYEYLSTEKQREFDQESKISKIAGTGSIIAIFIAAFGLLGLMGLTIQQKLREVSIRRVLGANINNIAYIIFKKFSLPILISMIVGLGGGAYIATKWLEDYQKRIDFGWIQISLPILIISVIFFTMIIIQVNRVVKHNPTIHLKEE